LFFFVCSFGHVEAGCQTRGQTRRKARSGTRPFPLNILFLFLVERCRRSLLPNPRLSLSPNPWLSPSRSLQRYVLLCLLNSVFVCSSRV
jgi:hypothetical protein